MSFSADAIANGLLDRAAVDVRKVQLTNLQLQKLVFFAHAWHLGAEVSSIPLIGEPVEAWKYGPVFRSLWVEFRQYEDKPITQKAFEIAWQDNQIHYSQPSVKTEAHEAGLGVDSTENLLDWIWGKYGGLDGSALVRLTHAEGEPWRIIKDQIPGELPKGLHIPNSLIRECYRKKVQEELRSAQE